jgi:hypothetical protein
VIAVAGISLDFADPQDYYGPIDGGGGSAKSGPDSAWIFTLASGTATPISGNVPEPSSLHLLAMGLVGLPLLRLAMGRPYTARA